jgi:hypothetical protein
LGARKGAFDALADLSLARAFAATLPEQCLPSTMKMARLLRAIFSYQRWRNGA